MNRKVQHRLTDMYLLPLAPLFKGKAILDIGSGDGYAANLFKVHGAHRVETCDPYKEPEYDVANHYHDILDVEGLFDIVWSHHAIEHMYNLAEFCSNVQRVGKELWLGCPNMANKNHYVPGHINNFTIMSLIAIFQRYGYGVIESKWWNESNQIRLRVPTLGNVKWPHPIQRIITGEGRIEGDELPAKWRWEIE